MARNAMFMLLGALATGAVLGLVHGPLAVTIVCLVMVALIALILN